jgi:malonate transporter and related proteins
MLAIIDIVAPVFGIMALGFLASRLGYLRAGAGQVIAEFAFKVAMPALLFRAMLAIGAMPVSPWRLVAVYIGAMMTVWIAASILTLVLLRRPAIDAPSIAMASCFGNTVMLGIPLSLTAFGPEAAAPVALLISIDAPLLWVVATMQMEAARRGGGDTGLSPWQALKGVLFDLLRNPIVIPLIAGSLWRTTELGLPKVLDRLLELMAGAAVPSALFALGMSLAAYEIKGQVRTLSLIIILKMLAFPAMVLVLATWIVPLPPLWLAIALLFSAMPVGANAFLFASRYERAIHSVSASIAVSTAIAVVTSATILYLLRSMVGP